VQCPYRACPKEAFNEYNALGSRHNPASPHRTIIGKFVGATEGAAADYGVVEQAIATAFDSRRSVEVRSGLTAAEK
jgi:hypothetical protein